MIRITENSTEDSHLLRISIRGVVTLLLVVCVCGMSVWGIEVKEPLYTLVGMAVGWYFGQKQNKEQANATPKEPPGP